MRTLLGVVAVVVSLSCLTAASNPPAPSDGKDIQKKNAKATIDKPKADIDLSIRGTKESPLYVEPVPKSKAETEHQQYEHHEKPTLDRWLTWGTVALAGITALLAFFTFGLWKDARDSSNSAVRDMRESLDIANKSAMAAQKSADSQLLSLRPWLSCHAEIAGPLTYTTDGDALFDLKFTIKNFGHTPAANVRLDATVALSSPKHEYSIAKLLKTVDLYRGLPIGHNFTLSGGVLVNSEIGRVLFPNEAWVAHRKFHVKRSEIEKACEDITPNTNYMPEVCALVAYSYPQATIRADTGFVYRIERQDGLFKLDEPVPMEEMSINDELSWGGFAT